MTTFASVRTHIVEAFYPRLSEWFCASILMALGFMLSENADLMTSSKTATFDLMLMIAPQEKWSLIMKLFATLRLVILLINGILRRSPHLRAGSAFLSLFFWTQIALSAKATFGFVFVFSAGIAVLDFLNVTRASRDARLVDYIHAKGGPEGGQN